MKRIFTLAILSCLFIGSISAESQYRKKTFDLFVTGNILQWEKVIDTMKNDPSCQSIEDKEELLSYYYGLVGHLIDIKDKKHARKVLDDALSIIKPLADVNPENALQVVFQFFVPREGESALPGAKSRKRSSVRSHGQFSGIPNRPLPSQSDHFGTQYAATRQQSRENISR